MRLIMIGNKALFFGLLLVCTAGAWAQTTEPGTARPIAEAEAEAAVKGQSAKPERPARSGNRRGNRARWWHNQDLAGELDLSAEQIAALDEWLRAQRKAQRERGQQQEQARRAVTAAIDAGEFELARSRADEAATLLGSTFGAEIDAAQSYRALLTEGQLEQLGSRHPELLKPPLRNGRQNQQDGEDRRPRRKRQNQAPTAKSEDIPTRDPKPNDNQ